MERTVADPQEIPLLWQAYKKKNDLKAREKLILHYVSLVRYVAGRFAMGLVGYFEFDDLLSAGVSGLLDAVERFNPDLGFKFETFAVVRIRGAILDWLRSLNWVPQSVQRRARKLENALIELEQSLGRHPEDQEVADYLGITVAELQQIIKQVAPVTLLSLDGSCFAASDGSNEPCPLQEIIPDSRAVDPSQSLEFQDLKETLANAIKKLPERERLVITLYYFEGLILKEIGKIMGVSESRVSQLHTKAILRLRGQLGRKKKDLLFEM